MDYEDDKKSKFNAGVALTERIDSLQRAINSARFNPLLTNQETSTFNYEIMISANDGLLKESWAKLSDAEKILGEKIKNLIHNFVRSHPPVSIDRQGKTNINKEIYFKLLRLIDIYEKKNKEFLDKHDLNAPSKDEDDGDYDY